MPQQLMNQMNEKMDKSISRFSDELVTIRTGRANPTVLNRVLVSYYGVDTPLPQLAQISVPEARQLVVSPYDKGVLGEIEQAIEKANLGFNPTNDGNIIRIAIPALTEDRRKELVKQVKSVAEEAKVAIRNIRRDINDSLKKMDIPEDEKKGYQDDVQKATDAHIKKIDEISAEKEQDIMTV